MSEIANEDLTLTHDADSATLSITTPPNAKVKTNSKKIYAGVMSINVTNAVKGGCTGASGVVIINGGATKVKAGGQAVVIKGDNGTGTANGLQGGSPCSFAVKVTVQDAGFAKVKAL